MDKFIDQPTVTMNAVLLLGITMASITQSGDRARKSPYRIHDADPENGIGIIEHDNGNRYRIRVEQISGIE